MIKNSKIKIYLDIIMPMGLWLIGYVTFKDIAFDDTWWSCES